MIPEPAIRAITHICGEDHILTTGESFLEYGADATKLSSRPDAVAFPADSQQVSRIIDIAAQYRFPVVPRGAGTGMSGGAVPVQGGLVMAVARMNRILNVDTDNLVARVEPGVITGHFQEAVEKQGLFYPPDPASLHISTLGGNVAECAGGLRAVKYGVTRDYVLGLQCVLPTGEILETGVQTMKGVAGYDLTRLIIGSEGTLAVITAITLRLLPKPEARRTMVAFFPDVQTAAKTVSHLIRNRILPTILEFMDRLSMDCVREEMGLELPEGAGAMLLLEVDGDQDVVDRQTGVIREACLGVGAIHFETARNPAEAESLWAARRQVSPSLFRLRPHKVSEDVVVPRSRIPLLTAFLSELSREYGLPIACFGHAGDGNIHVNVMYDRDLPGEAARIPRVVERVLQKVLDLGGTITGEHGIGITKAPYLGMEISRAGLQLMYRIKKAFDPHGILNPGKIFDPSQMI